MAIGAVPCLVILVVKIREEMSFRDFVKTVIYAFENY
jgi:hypothetical protein